MVIPREAMAEGSALMRTADCVPILISSGDGRIVAAVHAGWRGTVSGIVRAAIGKMLEEFGTRPAHIHAAIGPGIGKCCYEVGPEVAAQFGATGRAKIDLAEAIAHNARNAVELRQ